MYRGEGGRRVGGVFRVQFSLFVFLFLAPFDMYFPDVFDIPHYSRSQFLLLVVLLESPRSLYNGMLTVERRGTSLLYYDIDDCT